MYFHSFGIFGSSVVVSVSETWTDGVSTFRLQVRSIYLNLDQIMTAIGFEGGVQETDWDVIRSTKL